MMIPSSMTRFVEAISKAIAAMKSAPLRKSDRASATAAYEHEEDAAPSAVAIASERGEESGQEAPHLALGDHGLHGAGEREAEDQRPENLPAHPERERERVEQRVRQPAHRARNTT